MALGRTIEGPVALVMTRGSSRGFWVSRAMRSCLMAPPRALVALDGVERIAAAENLFAYPMARFTNPAVQSTAKFSGAEETERLIHWWRATIALGRGRCKARWISSTM